MASPGIHIRGAQEFQNAIAILMRKAGSVLLRVTSERAAERTVEAAKSTIPIVTGAASNSVTVIVESSGATVSGGGPGVPYFGILEFGGESGIGGSNIREYIVEGRYIMPAFKSQMTLIEFEINRELRSLVKASGLDIT